MATPREMELSAISFLVQNPEVYVQYRGHLDQLQWGDKLVKVIFDAERRLFDKLGKFPTQPEFTWVLDTHLEKEEVPLLVRQQILKDARGVYTTEHSGITREYIANLVMDREKNEITSELLAGDPGTLMERLPKVQERLDKIQSLGQPDYGDWVRPFSREYIDRPLSSIRDIYRGGVLPMGLPTWDAWLEGGMRPGELVVWMGITGGGKSLAMLHCGVRSAMAKKRVIYYALDNPVAEMILKLHANLSGWGISQPKEEEEYAEELGRKYEEWWDDYFLLRQWPRGSKTVSDIRRDLKAAQWRLKAKDLARGVPPEDAGRVYMIIVDYGDCLIAERSFREERHGLNHIFTRLGGIAEQENLVAMTGTQGNREALEAEVLNLKHISESYAKSFHSALWICICRTGAEKEAGLARLAQVKSRRVRNNYIVPVYFNVDTMRFGERADAEIHYITDEERRKRGRGGYSRGGTQETQERGRPVGKSEDREPAGGLGDPKGVARDSRVHERDRKPATDRG